MNKMQMNYFNPITGRHTVSQKQSLQNMIDLFSRKMEELFFKRGLIFFFASFLLGRAFILSTLSPFSLPFFAVIFLFRRRLAPLVIIGLVGGALSHSIINAIYTFMTITIFLLLSRVLRKFIQNEVRVIPYYVFVAILLGKSLALFADVLQVTVYNVVMAGVEASLAFVLTLIFMQSVPLLSLEKKHRHSLKTEEIVCLIILLASIITGTVNWEIESIAISNILARYIVLLFALAAGATVGTTVGVVSGLIFGLAYVENLSEMSLLAFAGLLGGLLREGKKIGVAFGLLLSTLLMGMYTGGTDYLLVTLYESLFATILLFLTPRMITDRLAIQIPGTNEHTEEQEAYLRKVRDITAKKVNQFSSLFETLSKSLSGEEEDEELQRQREIDFFLSEVAEKTCQLCYRKTDCWFNNFSKVYGGMTTIMEELQENNGNIKPQTRWKWGKYCSKSEKVIQAIKEELPYYQANKILKQQLKDTRKMVADQLAGVSKVMGNFAKEIQKEQANYEKQEEQIIDTLQAFGVEIDHIEIYSLQKGNIDIDITIPYCDGLGEFEKIIAPVLSDIVGETIVVHKDDCPAEPHEYCKATFRSTKRFVVDTGVAYAAKDGGFLSGDSFTMLEIGCGKYALAISDGMGNGESAYSESNDTIQLLQKMLQSGIDEETAIKSINSVLTLRTTDEIYSTLDLAIIDLRDAHSKFLKVGSSPSFIKRDQKVIKVHASNLPIGILEEVDVDVVNVQLMAGDLLIMMSDGVLEANDVIENVDVWLKRRIREIETNDPQEVADLILEEVIRSRGGQIPDDMTVLVAKIKHNSPKWATIPTTSLRKKLA